MKRKADSKHPPIQGVQISAMISTIGNHGRNRWDETPEQRLAGIELAKAKAIEMLTAYCNHWRDQINSEIQWPELDS